MVRTTLSALLGGGDRRSIGRANQVADLVLRQPHRALQLVKCMWSDDAVVRMRAADAAEKVSRKKPRAFRRFIPALLGLADETAQIELRWHLALMIPRLDLSSAERSRAFALFKEYLLDRSSIVKTFALQALTELAVEDQEMRLEVAQLLERASRKGTPAMRARARKLSSRLHE
jgi:hypothetical protein